MTGIYKYIEEAGKQDLLDMRDAINATLRKKFPGKNGKPKKELTPIEKFRLDAHRLAKQWLDSNGYQDYQWNGAQNKGLNGLLENIRCALSKNPQKYPNLTPESVLYSFAGFMTSLPKFYANKVDFLTFHHKFNAIVSEIRSNQNARKQINSNGGTGDVVAEALQRLNGGVSGR